MEYSNTIKELDKELIRLCKVKGLSPDEIFIIGATVACKEAIDRFGEEDAIKMAIEVIKLFDTVDEIFYAVEKALGFRE